MQIGHASRLVAGKELARVKAGIADGTIDIVIGTHALLGKAIKFRDLGLLIGDEEQHFGVVHKERLKQLRAEVHVLTLTATPIPRTLQLALTGVRDLSIIASPPVDRLAVRTFVSPFDQLVVREALLRERYRGGQSFYVCPRIEDIASVKDFLDNIDRIGVLVKELTTYLHGTVSRFCRSEKPIIMAVNGVAAGGGLSFALSGDLSERTLGKIARDLQNSIKESPGVLSADLRGTRDEVVEIIA